MSEPAPSPPHPTPARDAAPAWGVHLLTASGAVLAALALAAIAEGEPQIAAALMLVALAIDAVDGTLARAARAAERVPRIDGRRLDDIVDFANYVLVPSVFMGAFGGLPGWAWMTLPVLASAYGFSQVEAKTRDHFFLGFPSYWNVIALYLWLLGVSAAIGAAVVVLFAALVFVPLKYVYPSRMGAWRRTTIGGGVAWIGVLAVAIAAPDAAARLWLVQISLVYPAWYLGISLHLGRWFRED